MNYLKRFSIAAVALLSVAAIGGTFSFEMGGKRLSIGGSALRIFSPAPAIESAVIDAEGDTLTVTLTKTATGSGTGLALNTGTLGTPSGSGVTRTYEITPVVYEGQTRTLDVASSNIVDRLSQGLADATGIPVTNNSTVIPPESEGGGDFPLTMGSGTATYDTGYTGQAFVGNASRWAQASDITALALDDEWEISVRFKTTESTNSATILALGGAFDISITAGGAVGADYNGDTGTILSASGLNDGNWHSARMVLGASGATCELFVDEVSIGTDTGDRNNAGFSTFRVGVAWGGGSQFNGLIDEVKVRQNGTTYAYWKLDGTLDAEVGGDPIVYSDATTNAEENQPFRGYQILGTGTITSYGATGLPAGLSVNTGTGAITGTPTEFGEFEVDISATSATGTGNGTVTITVFEEKGWVYDDLLIAQTGTGNDMINKATDERTAFWGSSLDPPEWLPYADVGAGYAVTRQHVIQTEHLHATTFEFIIDGTVYSRSVAAALVVGDISIGLLDSPLPVGFQPARIIPNSIMAELEGREIPLVYFPGGELATFYGGTINGRSYQMYVTQHPHRQEWKRPTLPSGGESGTMVGLLFRLGVNHEWLPLHPNGGSGSVARTAAELQSWIDTVGNPNSYTVQEFAYP